MILFLIKKIFFDMWDNLFILIILNLGFVLLTAGLFFTFNFLSFNPILLIIGISIGILLLNLYFGTVSFMTGEIADYKQVQIRDIKQYFLDSFKPALFVSIISIFQFIVLSTSMPFYWRLGGIPGLGAVAVIFWISVIWWLSCQYYFPIYKRLDKKFKKVIKKCFLLFFDNTFFSIIIGIISVVIFILSIFTAFLLPGIAVILLLHQGALRLRLLKYDYLEENPDVKRNRIPWKAILLEDKEKIGPRSLRGMIFPWKE